VQVPSEWLVPLAAVSGVCLSLIGLALRLGQTRGVHPVHIWFFAGLMCAAAMAAMGWPVQWGSVPARVWVMGALTGLSQCAMLKIVRAALARGSLSPVWCAIMLGLIPVLIYGMAAVGERPTALHFGAIASALACIVVASAGHKGDAAAPALARARQKLIFGLLLIGLMLLNGVMGIAMKDLSSRGPGDGQSYMSGYREVFLLVVYVCMAAGSGLQFLVKRRFGAPVRASILLGLLAATGSVLGMVLMCIAARAPAAVAFTTNSVSSILAAALISALALREKVTPTWVATVMLATLTVLLANLG